MYQQNVNLAKMFVSLRLPKRQSKGTSLNNVFNERAVCQLNQNKKGERRGWKTLEHKMVDDKGEDEREAKALSDNKNKHVPSAFTPGLCT